MGSALIPVLIDHGLDKGNVILGNGPVSDGKRLHVPLYSIKQKETSYPGEKKFEG